MAKHRQPFLNNDVIRLVELNKEPEQKLWVAVLAKAFDDAFYCSDDNAAIDALRWIKHGLDFNYVCHLAGRNPNYVRKRMLDKVIEREASILGRKIQLRKAVDNVIEMKIVKRGPKPKQPKRKRKNWKNVAEFNWLPKYGHDYVER